ncbi:MAG: hypothetical protein WC219_02080 [Acholeplasmataceae bacterium]
MNVYRKSLIVQLLMFIVFIIMGVNVIVQYYIGQSFPVYNFLVLGLLVLFGIGGFLIYRKASNEIQVITPKELKTLKILLYVYLFAYIGEMLLSGLEQIPTEIIKISFGALLIVVALIGVFIQYQLLKKK